MDKEQNNKKTPNDKLTEQIIGAAYEVHNKIGPGFNEKVYHNAFKIALNKRNLKIDSEKTYKVHFENRIIGTFRFDLIINDKIIVEIKAVNGFTPKRFQSQVIAYLKSSNLKVGLLINFGNHSCTIRRIMNKDSYNQNPSPSPESIPSPQSFQKERR